jgi:hypothetical protein
LCGSISGLLGNICASAGLTENSSTPHTQSNATYGAPKVAAAPAQSSSLNADQARRFGL